MLIQGAEIEGSIQDARLAGGRIASIAPRLPRIPGEPVLAAQGGALLPGLHDHHIHLRATAAAVGSVFCGPPRVEALPALAAVLRAAPGEDWLRGIGFHDSIGHLDRVWLDANGPDRPVRLQHRGGRMWVFNSRAMALLGDGVPPDGRLIDGDSWLARKLPPAPQDLTGVGKRLAAFGLTGITEVTPRNTLTDYEALAGAGLPQSLLVMGRAELAGAPPIARARVGALKLHYHDYLLPPLEELAEEIAAAHATGRIIASHCVTAGELFLTLAALEIAGPRVGDRIEHAGIAPPEAVSQMADLGVTVVTQPHFLTERGAAYRAEMNLPDLPHIYRLRGLLEAGIPLAAGSDAPFGGLNPWEAMDAAVNRPEGFGDDESLTPEQALALYTGTADAPGGPPRRVAVGETADLCLLDRNWASARRDLAAVRVRATIIQGVIASTNPQASAV